MAGRRRLDHRVHGAHHQVHEHLLQEHWIAVDDARTWRLVGSCRDLPRFHVGRGDKCRRDDGHVVREGEGSAGPDDEFAMIAHFEFASSRPSRLLSPIQRWLSDGPMSPSKPTSSRPSCGATRCRLLVDRCWRCCPRVPPRAGSTRQANGGRAGRIGEVRQRLARLVGGPNAGPLASHPKCFSANAPPDPDLRSGVGLPPKLVRGDVRPVFAPLALRGATFA
jgi:hypothetical protein